MDAFATFFADKTLGNPARGLSFALTGNIAEDMDNLKLVSNKEGITAMGLTYVACMVPGSTISKSFNSINDIVITVKYPRGFALTDANGDLLAANTPIFRADNHANGNTPTYLTGRASADDYGDYGLLNIAHCPDMDARGLYLAVVNGFTDWKGHFFNLYCASEVKDLTADQIKSYFKWFRVPEIEGSSICKIFPSITSGIASVRNNAALLASVSEGKWIDYRLTFSSGGLLLVKMLDECPPDYLTIFSDETKDAIRHYGANKSSEAAYRAIPEKASAVLYAYLLASDQMVDGLYGPKKSYDALTVSEKTSLKNWFTEAMSKITTYGGGVFGLGNMPESLKNV